MADTHSHHMFADDLRNFTAFMAVLAARGCEVEAFLAGCLKDRDIPPRLLEAMEYSLLAGGKRIRPVLCCTTAELYGLARAEVLPFACGMELIHTYSLVHDDLPAMDDDDMRRGKPSNHKMFGDALAILAGDGLLIEAFRIMAQSDLPACRVLSALVEVVAGTGATGMVGGQAIDMDFTGRSGVSLDELQDMHRRKTGSFVACACVAGVLLAGADATAVARLRAYGAAIGVAFQITDDILDEVGDEKILGKPVGSDREHGKATYPSLIGLAGSCAMAERYVTEALACLDGEVGEAAAFLVDLARYILVRAH
ncbi:geranyl diphosphate/farnesyl diphosphate synthase [Desulfovibrionales bacterium]